MQLLLCIGLALVLAGPATAQTILTLPIRQPDREARVRLRVEPAYPEHLRAAGIGGRMALEAHVAATGQVDTVRVLHGLHPLLDSSAVAAVRQWIFWPAVRDGRAVATWFTVPVRFRVGPPLLATDPPEAVSRPLAPDLLTFGPGLRANPDACTQAAPAQPFDTPHASYYAVHEAAWNVEGLRMDTQAWLLVNEAGRVDSLSLVQTQGYAKAIRIFEEQTRAALLRWRLLPATCNGEAVRSWFLVPVTYRQ